MKTINPQEIRKFLEQKNDPESQLKKLKTYTNAINSPLYDLEQQQKYQVKINPDSSLKPAQFIPDPLLPNVYRAHPVTIRALRKDLFLAGDDFVDLQQERICDSCKNKIDLQFWIFCPYCESSFN